MLDQVGEIVVTLSSGLDLSDQERLPDHPEIKSRKPYHRKIPERFRTESTSSDISINSSEDVMCIPQYDDLETDFHVARPSVSQPESHASARRGRGHAAKTTRQKREDDFVYSGQSFVIERTENWDEEFDDEPVQKKGTKKLAFPEKDQSSRSSPSRNAQHKQQHATSSSRVKDPKATDHHKARNRSEEKSERIQERGGRRRDERVVEKHGSEKDSLNDNKRGKLNVTFNDHVREVKVPAEEGGRRNRRSPVGSRDAGDSRTSAREMPRKPRVDHHEEFLKPTSPTAKGGGIIHLPQNVHLSSSPTSDGYHRGVPPPHHEQHGRGHRGRGRGNDHSRLWDPSKPEQKPIANSRTHPQPLQFHDPEFDRYPDPEWHYPRESEFQPPQGAYPPRNYYSDYPSLNPGQKYPEHGHPERQYQDVTPYVNQGQYPYPYYEPGYGYPQPKDDRSWSDQMESAMPYYPPPPPAATRSPTYSDQRQDYGRGDDSTLQMVKARNKDSAHRLFSHSEVLEIQLSNLLSRRFQSTENIDSLFKLRMELEQVYEGIILLDVNTANKRNIEMFLWKNAYYQVIECFRKQVNAPESESEDFAIKERLLKLIDQGTSFFESLINKLQETYHFKLSEMAGIDPIQDKKKQETPRETELRLGLQHCQKCMVYLGDLARYKEQAQTTNNYGKARSWYLKAAQIAPSHGKAYNQLAILAVYTRRKLDAVYYYMRSLASRVPSASARESLTTLFEEARRKAEHTEKKQKEAEMERRQSRRQKKNINEDVPFRIEMWVSHDGSIMSSEANVEDEVSGHCDLSKLSPVELNKRFVLNFLHVHGKLFTKIGMEKFPEVAHLMLQEFQALLDHSPSPLGNTRLLQLMAINVFAIQNTALKDPVSDSIRSFIQEQAIQLGLDMFSVIVSRCVQLLKENDNNIDNKSGLLGEDLHEYLPSVKVWGDWMGCNQMLWNPPPDCCAPEHSISVDLWSCLAELFNLLKVLDKSKVAIISEPKEGYEMIVLNEDLMMAGFSALTTLPMTPQYVDKQSDKILVEDTCRVAYLLLFSELLCGLENPLLTYSVEKECYVSLGPTRAQSEKVDSEKDISSSLSQEEDDVIIESSADEAELEDDVNAKDIRRLKAQKNALKKRVKEEQRRKEHIEAVVESHRGAKPVALEIRPFHLVPDTNAFIDNLKGIQTVVDSGRYILIVPLVVINELDGLAKGSREDDVMRAAHSGRVQQGAKAAINYLEGEFDMYNNRIRAVTSRGTELDTIQYRREDPEGQVGNNDDVILSCCLFYCDDKARSFMPQNKDDPIKLFRDVVLLTDDRNLRVKAHIRNVPARGIPDFLVWAKLVNR
ncbi:telomerase-binding protein EST1A-like [Glandiceps talaboti]